MDRVIDIENERHELNEWVLKSIELFENTPYLDNLLEVYPLESAIPVHLEPRLKRRIISAHQGRRTTELIEILQGEVKFPYDEPLAFMIKQVLYCLEKNPKQIQRIANTLYAMEAEELIIHLESAPKLNTQMGPMFTTWLRKNFNLLNSKDFEESSAGIFILSSSETEGKDFVNNKLSQNLRKRPDLVAKVNNTYIIGEAKWIGRSGGNQNHQVRDVLDFCKEQRGAVIRIGIIDGFPWAIRKLNNSIINDKANVLVQESPYDIVSSLLLNDYLKSFL
ncbi:hypothetical protein [Christiangramia sediminis]|uniref:Tsp45I type II restriction enzyme n=1 Tax=Christiangramia sediminis TaxID=2881336 RepID=A0A9X1RZF5_9FLAO|nr:hypothetical protein [Christiangramia sediminis]MCB7482225.1 hypothetical protein [Christiangramia sediminis]